MEESSTIIGISTCSLIIPPLLPKRPIVFAFLSVDVTIPFLTLTEFPLVEIPKTTSPSETSASHCRLKIESNEKSFPIDVRIEVSVVNAIAGKLFLSFLNLLTNSAAICCASAALPPFPKIIILFPFFKQLIIYFIAFSTISERLVAFLMHSALSKIDFSILSFIF